MLFTFEGIDGSGKSTQVRLLAQRLEASGHAPLLLREPGGVALAERIRTLLLDPLLDIAPFAELLLFSAARAQLVAECIRPALEAGRTVLCDRFYDSTVAYQGGGRALEDPAWLHDFNQRVTGGLVPIRTYLFDLDPIVAHQRRTSRQAEAKTDDDRIEATGIDFHQRVALTYRKLAEENPERILLLDATEPVETLHERIWQDFQRLHLPGLEPAF